MAGRMMGGPGPQGFRQVWNGGRVRQQVQDVEDAVFDTMAQRARDLAQSLAHVWTGEMQEEVFADVERRGPRIRLDVGSRAPHTVYEVSKGGDHAAFIWDTVDSLATQIAPLLRAESKARGF